MKGVVIHARVRSHVWQYRGLFSPPTKSIVCSNEMMLFAKDSCILIEEV